MTLSSLCLLISAALLFGSVEAAPAYTNRPRPIAIVSNAGFLAPDSGVTGGNGTAASPYRISGWQIVSTDTPAIVIANTTAHLVIENNLLTGSNADATVSLQSVQNVTISSNQITDNFAGLDVFDSHGISILGNTLEATTRNLNKESEAGKIGIRLQGGSGLTISHNTLRLFYNSITGGGGTRNATFVNNQISDARHNGISLGARLSELSFVGNHIWNVPHNPLTLQEVDEVSVIGNVVEDTGDEGIELIGQVSDVTIIDNTLRRNAQGGIKIGGTATNVTISGNSVSDNGFGMQLGGALAGEVLVENNTVSFNAAPFNNIHSRRGIVLYGTGNVTLRANLIEGNGQGLVVSSCATCTVKGNTIRDNEVGILGVGDTAARFCDNNIEGNTLRGAETSSVKVGYSLNLLENWWGAADGPAGEGPGSGDGVGPRTAFNPWLTASVTADRAGACPGLVNGSPTATPNPTPTQTPPAPTPTPTASPTSPPKEFCVRYTPDPAFTSMGVGSTRTVRVGLENCGTRTWGPSTLDTLSYHWFNGANTNEIEHEGLRVTPDRDVPPGGTIEVSAPVRAPYCSGTGGWGMIPCSPGNYTIRWDMIRGGQGAFWYSQRGIPTEDRLIAVGP